MKPVMLFCLFLLCLVVPGMVMADGMMFMDAAAVKAARERVERAMINEPEQKAVIFFSKGEEQLIISPSYDGATEKFAWVVPVPTRPKVEIADAAIFEELADMTTYRFMSKAAGPPVPGNAKPEVKVVERKVVGDYDVAVLSSEDSSALMDWLSGNGYHVPEQALKPIQDYVKRRWTFVACKVIDSKVETAEKLRNGTLSPLKLTFRSGRPVYPMKLSSANPEPFDLLLYLVLPDRPQHFTQPILEKASPGSYKPDIHECIHFGEEWRQEYPTLAKLSPHVLSVWIVAMTQYSKKAKPEECKQDLFWNIFDYPPSTPPLRLHGSSFGSRRL